MFKRFSSLFHRGIGAMSTRPTMSFFILLALLFGIIALGYELRTPTALPPLDQLRTKETTVFTPALSTAFTTVPVKVTKDDVVHIVALTRGIVTTVLVSPGHPVRAGQTLLILTDDYQGGRANLNKKVAEESARLTEELAKIDKRIAVLDEKRIRHDDSLSDTQEKIALEQVKKNRAARKSALEQSTLSLALSTRNDAVLKPRTFISGTVQSVPVRPGDLVASGDIIATLAAPYKTSTLEAFLDARTAALFDPTKEARLTFDSEVLSLRPTFFSRTENERGLFSVQFTLSESTKARITDGQYLSIDLPLKSDQKDSLLIPIDAVFQDSTEATVLVERDGRAAAVPVTLGTLHGAFAEIRSGLAADDRVILNRTVIANDAVTVIP